MLIAFCSSAENDHFGEQLEETANNRDELHGCCANDAHSVLQVGAGHFLFMQRYSLAHSSGSSGFRLCFVCTSSHIFCQINVKGQNKMIHYNLLHVCQGSNNMFFPELIRLLVIYETNIAICINIKC